MLRWPQPCLMLITDRSRLRGRAMEEVASLAIEGGVNVVQLREKDMPTAELHDLAATIHAVIRGRALLVVNDRTDIALAIGADGVHLPEQSLPGQKARDVAGDGCIVGGSVHSVDAAISAEADGADYVQIGTIYKTASKAGREAAGPELISAVRKAVSVPVIAVGGITAENAGEAITAGADGIAVIGAIMDAADPKQAACDLCRALDAAYAGQIANAAREAGKN